MSYLEMSEALPSGDIGELTEGDVENRRHDFPGGPEAESGGSEIVRDREPAPRS